MKRILTTLFISLLTAATTLAQPSPVKKAARGVLKITTFKADGTIQSTGYGALTDADGTAIAAWTPFEGAQTAVAIDGKGTRYDVDCIYGANEMYNVVRLKLKIAGKFSGQTVPVETQQQAIGNDTWYIGYDPKTPQFIKITPAKIETFMTDMPYYIYEQDTPIITEAHTGGVVVNSKGELMGLIQNSSTRTDFYVASARYALTLQPSGLSMNSNTLRTTNVRIALPTEYNQALLALIISSQRNDSLNHPATIDEFITLFPDKQDGYEYKARLLSSHHDYAAASSAMEKAIEVSDAKDNGHYAYARMIYGKIIDTPEPAYEPWTLDKALSEAENAYAINPLPLYSILKGQIMYSQNNFSGALAEFDKANKSEPRSGEVYYYAYQCLKNMKESKERQLEMLDSANVVSPNTLIYLSEKALLLMKMNRAADAITTAQQTITIEPRYAEGHGILGLALCMTGNKATGLAELRRAKALGYQQADAFIATYDDENEREKETKE